MISDLYLYPDLETSGLWRSDLAPDDPSQPRMASLGLLVTDANRKVLGNWYSLIKPDGWSMEPQAAEVNGISEREAHAVGLPAFFALAVLEQFTRRATKIVGHNLIMFDRQVIANELRVAGQLGAWWHSRATDMIDTMEMASPIMKLESKLHGEFKSPSLQEAVRFFGQKFNSFEQGEPAEGIYEGKLHYWEQTHRADQDAAACEFVHYRLRTMGAA